MVCEFCKRKFTPKRISKGVKNRFCSRVCSAKGARKLQVGEKHPHWKGGRHQNEDGYIYIRMPNHPFAKTNGYIAEHRLLMEKKLGRLLNPNEVVHHMNHVPWDNRIENLILLVDDSQHSEIHYRQGDFKKDENNQKFIKQK